MGFAARRDGLPDQAVRAAPRADTVRSWLMRTGARFCWPGRPRCEGIAATSSNCAGACCSWCCCGHPAPRPGPLRLRRGARTLAAASAGRERPAGAHRRCRPGTGHRRSAPAALRRGRPAGGAERRHGCDRLRCCACATKLGSFQSMGLIDTQGTIVCAALPQALRTNRRGPHVLPARAGDPRVRRRRLSDQSIAGTANINFAYPVEETATRSSAWSTSRSTSTGSIGTPPTRSSPPDSTLTVLVADQVLARLPDPGRWSGPVGARFSPDLPASPGPTRTAEGTDASTALHGLRVRPAHRPGRAGTCQPDRRRAAAPCTERRWSSAGNVVVLIAVWLVTLGACWFVAEP